MIRGRLRRHGGGGEPDRPGEDFVEIDPAELTGVFANLASSRVKHEADAPMQPAPQGSG